MKWGDRLLVAIAPPVAAIVIRLLHLTIRSETIGVEHLRSQWDRGQRVLLSFWHDQLLLMVLGYPGRKAKALISPSKDGELLARVICFFGHDSVRGSSSRGGREAFRNLLRLAREPVDLVFTPDGPKGPRHQIKDGVLQMARMSGRPIVPMAFVASHGHRFASWDRFLLPFPFARGVYSFGEPVFYQKGEAVDDFRQRVVQAMSNNQRHAEQCLEARGATAV